MNTELIKPTTEQRYPLSGLDARQVCTDYLNSGWGWCVAYKCITCKKRGCCYPQDEELETECMKKFTLIAGYGKDEVELGEIDAVVTSVPNCCSSAQVDAEYLKALADGADNLSLKDANGFTYTRNPMPMWSNIFNWYKW